MRDLTKTRQSVASVMAYDEPTKNSNLGYFIIAIVGFILCASFAWYLIGILPTKKPVQNQTSIHDTVRITSVERVVVHDTVVLHSQPITFVCEGICTDISGFERR